MGKKTLVKKTAVNANEEVPVFYFARDSKEQAAMIWDTRKNVIAAACAPNGLFAVTNSRTARTLKKLGYRAITEKDINAAGLVPPKPDVTDYTENAIKSGRV